MVSGRSSTPAEYRDVESPFDTIESSSQPRSRSPKVPNESQSFDIVVLGAGTGGY